MHHGSKSQMLINCEVMWFTFISLGEQSWSMNPLEIGGSSGAIYLPLLVLHPTMVGLLRREN